jgi:hypothetical protein
MMATKKLSMPGNLNVSDKRNEVYRDVGFKAMGKMDNVGQFKKSKGGPRRSQ